MNKLIQSLSALGVSATLVSPNLSAAATDNSIPELKGTKDTIIEKGEGYNLLKGVSAFDKEDGDLTHKITVDESIDPNKIGKYKVEYKVEDSDGAIKKSVRYVEVK
ncbi:immunoglobulin-like domain-containing protein [Staphylococcus aureus]